MRLLISSILSLPVIMLLSASPVLSKEPDGARLRFQISALDRKIDEFPARKFTLWEVLDELSRLASLPGYENDPAKRVTIRLNYAGYSEQFMDFVQREQVNIEKKLVNERLDTMLSIVCKQIRVRGVVMVRDEFIEIVPRESAIRELKLNLAEDEPMPVLIHEFFNKVPLEKALEKINERYKQNIVLAPLAGPKAATLVTARLINVPIGAAVETLANLAELRAVRKANKLYVTTKEQAATLRAEEAQSTKEPRTK